MTITVETILMCLFIFFARICDVTFMSIRTILLTKGMPKLAAVFGFFEVIIYISVLGKVISTLDNPIYLISYGLGYSAGNYVGSKIENMLAFGDAQVRIILDSEYHSVVDGLRDKGVGVTVFKGEGRDGQREMLLINLKRKRIKEIYEYFNEKNIKAFISTNDITSYSGGYHVSSRRFIDKVKK